MVRFDTDIFHAVFEKIQCCKIHGLVDNMYVAFTVLASNLINVDRKKLNVTLRNSIKYQFNHMVSSIERSSMHFVHSISIMSQLIDH